LEKRKRPITYAEALEAKEFAEKMNADIISDKNEINQEETTLNGVEVKNLPSGGVLYGNTPEIFFTPLSFGEMKFLSGSSLSDKESIQFFLNKIQCNFDKYILTYFDFYYITVLIKLSTFGETSFKISYKCPKCNNKMTKDISTSGLNFEEIRVDIPVEITSKNGKTYTFSPITIGSYLNLLDKGLQNDKDAYMASQITSIDFEQALDSIKNDLNGTDVQLLETIDIMFYHGVEDIQIICKNKVKKGDSEEVCGFLTKIPFFSISEYASSIDSVKELVRNRIHYGV